VGALDGVTLGEVCDAVAKSNCAAGGGVVPKNNAEYLVRFVGWIKGKEDIENTVIRKGPAGTPLLVKNVAAVQLGQQFRRSVCEKDGNEVTGGMVLMRYGQNPLAVAKRVKEKIHPRSWAGGCSPCRPACCGAGGTAGPGRPHSPVDVGNPVDVGGFVDAGNSESGMDSRRPRRNPPHRRPNRTGDRSWHRTSCR
jgi:hypothetical protein